MSVKESRMMGKISDEELLETLDEIVDDENYLYENPEEEIKESKRVAVILLTKNIIICIIFFIIAVFGIGIWRTLTYGKTSDGYTIVNKNRIQTVDYINITESWHEDILNFIDLSESTERQPQGNIQVLNMRNDPNKSLILNDNIAKYQKWVETIEEKKYFANNSSAVVKRYNNIMSEMGKMVIEIMQNEIYFGKTYGNRNYCDYNEDEGIKNNFLSWETDLKLDDYKTSLLELKKSRIALLGLIE